jgi:hypothetical protein
MDEEIKSHLTAIEAWLARHRGAPRAAHGLSSDERKQLHAVEKSIQQLSASGVAIPDALRQIKLQLSAKDVVRSVEESPRERVAEVGEVSGALNRLTQTAKALYKSLKVPGKPLATKQRFEVTLDELVQAGHLSPDDKLEFSWQKAGPVFEGKVRAGGTLMAKTPSGWKAFDSLSAAATSIGECSLNGWLHWRRVNADGSRTSLKDIRARYLNEGGAQ